MLFGILRLTPYQRWARFPVMATNGAVRKKPPEPVPLSVNRFTKRSPESVRIEISNVEY